MTNPVGWFEIYVEDLTRAKAFYEAVFQLDLTSLEMPDCTMLTFPMDMEKPGASGALVKMQGVPAGANSTMVYFSCDDCATEQQRASESGGKVFKEKFSIGEHGYIAIVLDTEGNMIGLHSMQ